MVVASAPTGTLRESTPQLQLNFEAVFFEIGRRSLLAARAPDLLAVEVVPQYEAITKQSWDQPSRTAVASMTASSGRARADLWRYAGRSR